MVLDVGPAVAAAVRGLGPDLAFYTRRQHPLTSIAGLRNPGVEIASPHLQLGRGVLALLRAGNAPIDPGATDLMTLLSEHQVAGVFAGQSPVVLLLLRDAAAGDRVDKAGGLRVVFRDVSTGKLLGAAARAPGQSAMLTAVAPSASAVVTSFGPLQKAERASTARQRHFDPVATTVESRAAGKGHQFVVLHIRRDFSRGAGTVSFLYGSGIVFQPHFAELQLEAGGQKLRPAAVFDEGPTLELAYEIPSGSKSLTLIDGDARTPLAIE
jgi:hypothetical protein